MSKIALTGHTRGLGSHIFKCLLERNHDVLGYSQSTGCDLRDYSQVETMIREVKTYDWFINCAHPDYCQSQILYRLIRNEFNGKVLNIGSPVVHHNPNWDDLYLLEYITQKTALWHAYTTLSNLYPEKIFIWEPSHTDNQQYVFDNLVGLGL